ncbi:MAG: riboflavin biosynthesis protein RibF [Candidatus Delongbacteria bacterium]|jgi:riboflavin kinase/FMN adenylyltransferase|nr:riboflavin biosynthesis protein RibF [Candidatus Delongbacteria bacterium]
MEVQNKYILPDIQGKPLIITVGMFDGVHRGHRYFIDQMKEKARNHSLLPVVITMHPHPSEILSGTEFRYLTTLVEKQELIHQLGIKYVLVLKTNTSLMQKSAVEFLEALKSENLNINMIAMGYNNSFGNPNKDNLNTLPEIHKPAIYTVDALSENINSTQVRKTLRAGDVIAAADMLGHPYVLYGKVVEGNKMGRTIGFPTANIQVSSVEKMIPATGVYAVICNLGGRNFPGMMNIGYRPTLREETKKLVLEVHVPGETMDIYNQEVKIEFCKKIRDEKRFNDMQALKVQLEKDKDFIKSYFSGNFANSNNNN